MRFNIRPHKCDLTVGLRNSGCVTTLTFPYSHVDTAELGNRAPRIYGPMEEAVAKEAVFPVRGSLGCTFSNSGIVKKTFFTMRSLRPSLNSLTCHLMYLKNASLDHRPRSMIW